MKVAALLGHPLGHSVTPAMYGPAFAALGLDAVCEKWVTPPEDLGPRVAALRGAYMLGANVTVPHKETIIPLIDAVAESARDIGAVNCVVREPDATLTGHNTDKYGFMRSLREAGFEAQSSRAFLLGAGGAARAVAFGLVEAGAKLTIANRTRVRAEALASNLRSDDVRVVDWEDGPLEDACADAALIVNSTSMGMVGSDLAGESPVGRECFHAGAYAFDLVYNPLQTPFLRLAAAAGAIPIAGLDMLVYQGAESIRLWTGLDAPTDLMKRAALAALGLKPEAVA